MHTPAPAPAKPTGPFFSRPLMVLGTLACFVIVVAGMRAAAMIVVPFLLSVFIAVIVTPLFIGLQRRGMRAPFALIVIVMLLLGVSSVLFVLLSTSITTFNQKLPEYRTKLAEQQEAIFGWLKQHGVDFNTDFGGWATERPPRERRGAEPSQPTPPAPAPVPSPAPVPEASPAPVPAPGAGEPTEGPALAAEDEGPAADDAVASVTDDVATVPPESPEEIARKALDFSFALKYLGTFTSATVALLSQSFIILIVVIFILFEAMVLPGKVRALPGISEDQWQRMREIVDNIRRYMLLKTLVSLLTGLIVAVMLGVLGIPFALPLGLLAFALNFVPNIGSFIAAVPAVLLALVDDGLAMSVGVAIGYVVINVGIGNGLEPRIMGQGLGLSPLIILVSLIFWGWVLGPVGMLLSVPLTMTAKIVLEADESTRWIALLMSGSGAARARLLAARRVAPSG